MTTPRQAVPRYRPFSGPALFRQGFRPFFLGAGLWSALAVALWMLAFPGLATIPSAFDPVAWHAHEMLFGFVVAAIAGFLLTSVPNWTGRMPLQGAPLAALFAAWLIGRIAMATSALVGVGLAALIDLTFLAALLAVLAREIIAGRNWRNLPVLAVLVALLAANVLSHADALGWLPSGAIAQRAGIGVVVLLISLIGGRIVPSFTRNWLAKRQSRRLPAPFDGFDRFCLGAVLVAVAAWVGVPEHPGTGIALLTAGAANLARLARWRGDLTLSEPLVWSLHLGFAWIPVGLLLLGASLYWAAIPGVAGVHALTAGAFGTMTLAVMTRATLGHTGRALHADGWMAAIYLLVAAAAALRVLASLLPDAYMELLGASSAAWIATFGLFSIGVGWMLVTTPERRG